MTRKPSNQDLVKRIQFLEKETVRRKNAEERVKHLNRVLRAIRNVHQLTLKEMDRDRLIRGVCERLTAARGYRYAWIALMEEPEGFITAAESGLGWTFLPMLDRLERSELPDRTRQALKRSGVAITADPLTTCRDCPLCNQYHDTGAMTTRLESDGTVYGVMSASVHAEFLEDREEQSLFRGLAEDLSFALRLIELNGKRKEVESALRESEESFRDLSENAGDGITILGETGAHLYVNRRAAEMTGYSVEELLHSSMLDVIHPHEHDRVSRLFKKRMGGGSLPASYETLIVRKDGKEIPIEVTGARTVWKGQRADIVFSRDITERKRAEEELNRKHAQLEAIFNALPDAVLFADLDRNVTKINPGFTKLFGYGVDEIWGKKTQALYADKEDFRRQGEIRYNPHARDTHKPFEVAYRRKNGEIFLSETVGTPVRDEKDSATGLLAIVRDITHRKETERALYESEQNFRALAENAGDGVSILAEDGSILFVNKRNAEILGYAMEELLRFNMLDVVHPHEREKMAQALKKRIRGELLPVSHETLLLRKDGKAVPVEVTGARTIWQGQPADIVFSRDITERKRAEEALRESEEFSSSLLENSPNPILVINPDSSVRYVNPALEKLTGVTSAEVVGKKAPYPWWTEEMLHTTLKHFQEGTIRETLNEERMFRKKNGEGFWVDLTFTAVRNNEGLKYYLSNWVETTDRKRAEQTLRESEERFRKTVENAPFGYYRVGGDGCWQYVNPQWEKMHGYSLQEIRGKSFELTQPGDLREEARVNFQRALGGETITGEFGRRRKDGTHEYHTFNMQPVGIGGKIVAVEGFVNDLTEQKHAEESVRRLSHQLLGAHERERQMISRELHDRLAQDLSASKIVCDTLIDDQSTVSPAMRQRVSELSRALEKTIMAVRDLSYDLRPPVLDQMGLAQTIFRYCDDFSERYGLCVDFNSAGLEQVGLDGDTEINLYRMVQEGLNNVLKHADATRITVKLVAAYPDIILRIEDNGKGFDVKQRLNVAGDERRMGLRSMRERTALIGGEMTIQSVPRRGTRICIRFPYVHEDQDPNADQTFP